MCAKIKILLSPFYQENILQSWPACGLRKLSNHAYIVAIYVFLVKVTYKQHLKAGDRFQTQKILKVTALFI